MSSNRPRFADIVTVLHSGKPAPAAAPQPTPKAGRGKGGKKKQSSAPPDDAARAPVYASIMEGESTADGRLRIGLAATNPATMEFHLFSLTESDGLSTLKSLLKALDPTDVIVNADSTSTALHDAVRAVCQQADIAMAKQTLYEGGLNTYARLTAVRAKLNVKNATEEELCLGAFAALVKFAEHQRDARFPRSSLTIAFRGDPGLLECPLCDADEEANKVVMGSVKEIQEHFFQEHWQLHGYACHLCGEVYQTAAQLLEQHTECDAWTRWRAAWKGNEGELKMTHGRMLLCCADCGWHTVLEQSRGEETGKIGYLKNFFAHHNNDGLLTMMVYFPARPAQDLTTMRLSIHSTAGGDPTAPCTHCRDAAPFKDPAEANEHYMQFHRDNAIVCGVEACGARVTTDYLLEQHQMSHVNDNSFFADYLSNTARIHPPPDNLSHAPRCGWKDRANTEDFAFGGVMGGGGGEQKGKKKGYDLIGPMEDVRQAKARLVKSRGRNDKGYEKASFPKVSRTAKRVMEDLRKKYSHVEGIASFDEHTWLTDESAQKFADWMAYWESREGREKGGPPKQLVVELPPSAIVRIPSMEVTLQLRDADTLSGFLLNENLFYCFGCDTILKGNQASKHLKPNKDQTANKCALQSNGRNQPNPIKNSNMFQLYSHAAAPPDYTLPCPHCDRKSCSITGLRVHIMCAHGTFVKCKREDSEVMPDALSLKFNLRSKLNRDRQTAARLEKDMKALNLQKKQGRKAAIPVVLKMEGSDDDIEVLGQRLVRSKKRKAEDDDAVWQAVQDMVNRVVRKEDQRNGVETEEKQVKREIKNEPVFVLLDDEAISSDHDSDVVVMEVDEEAEARRNLSAAIREESESASAGGKGEPGYEDEEMVVDEAEAMDVQQVVRQFTPDDEDDELCVVAEVENTGVVGRAATIESQREKKFACGKCSDRFRTQASLAEHRAVAHQFDAGDTTILEELGIPLQERLYLCRNCCLAFPTPDMKTAHALQHGQKSLTCDHCCGVAYNGEVLAHHHRRVNERKVAYVCGECKVVFDNEINLHEHSNSKHGVTLFYFCKECELGSTNGVDIYNHFMRGRCPTGFYPGRRPEPDAWKYIGVLPANQLHFQPIDLECHKIVFDMTPTKYATPSLCTHRSMIVAAEQKITCSECKGLQAVATYAANYEIRTGERWDGQLRSTKCAPPLSALRTRWETLVKARQRDENQRIGAVPPNNHLAHNVGASTSRGGRATASASAPSVLRAPQGPAAPRQPINRQEANQRPDNRIATPLRNLQASTSGGGAVARSPMQPATGSSLNEGGGAGMGRGAQPPVDRKAGGGGEGAATMRGAPVVRARPANGQPARMLNWGLLQGYIRQPGAGGVRGEDGGAAAAAAAAQGEGEAAAARGRDAADRGRTGRLNMELIQRYIRRPGGGGDGGGGAAAAGGAAADQDLTGMPVLAAAASTAAGAAAAADAAATGRATSRRLSDSSSSSSEASAPEGDQ